MKVGSVSSSLARTVLLAVFELSTEAEKDEELEDSERDTLIDLEAGEITTLVGVRNVALAVGLLGKVAR